jgi:hypothetical protein
VDKISNDDQKSLLEQFSLEEIKEAVFGMEPNKAAGPDGFNADFYQKNWELVKSDIKSMFDKFYAGKLDITRFNYGVVTLIPKGKDADCIHKYRPICLLNVILKKFTKALVTRLVKIIWKVIKLS